MQGKARASLRLCLFGAGGFLGFVASFHLSDFRLCSSTDSEVEGAV